MALIHQKKEGNEWRPRIVDHCCNLVETHALSRAENADEQTPHRTAPPNRDTLQSPTPQMRYSAVYG